MMFAQAQKDIVSHSLGLVCLLVLGLMTVGCAETAGSGGSGGDGGTGGMAGQVFPCTEQGIRDAIAEGGGPHTFDCDGPTTVVTEATIPINNNVILDGEGNLTVDGDNDHLVFEVVASVELHRIVIAKGSWQVGRTSRGGLFNGGTLVLANSAVLDNDGSGIITGGSTTKLTVVNSTISGNSAADFGFGSRGGGIFNVEGDVTLINCTVSGNTAEEVGGGIDNFRNTRAPTLTIISSTISGNQAPQGSAIAGAFTREVTNTIVDGDCSTSIGSRAYNIESPGDTCGFDQPTDQVNVGGDDLKLGELADNGGPTMTHALGAGSVAIDQIPAVDCVDADGAPLTTDQRGERRPAGAESKCDIGSVEAQASN